MGVNKMFGNKEWVVIIEKVWKPLTRGKPQHFTANNLQNELHQGQIFQRSRNHPKILGTRIVT
jgi:hypothetical protein